MAKFKLYLITTKSINNSGSSYVTEYLKQPISEFSSSLKDNIKNDQPYAASKFSYENTFCYTYNEKFSIHMHAQKELTFSLDRYFTREDRIEYNPFAPYMSSGTQLLLVDRYNNHHLMTITKVQYEFKEHNVVYNITCQDSFTYQTIRQNDGYSIENDSSQTDFIGARDIDWWAEKITTECYVGYTYLGLKDELFLCEDNTVTLKKPDDNIVKQIKKDYSQEGYDTIPFKASGSASSVLIELAEQLGLSLQVFEYFDENDKIVRYFWFEPSKKNEISGLTYSPYSDIETFSLTHNGASLTTVLNVQSHEIADELISILPSAPLFFKDYFKSEDWKQSKYKTGMYSNLITGETFTYRSDDLVTITIPAAEPTSPEAEDWVYRKMIINAKDGNLYIPLYTDDKKLEYKDNIWYPYEELTDTTIVYKDADKKEHIWTDKTFEYFFTEVEDQNGEKHPFVVLKGIGENAAGIQSYSISYHRYRKYTEEELQFAHLADQCPWLENKIIDFDYFITHNILTKFEYAELVKLIYDELRLVNGQLLIWAEAYYKALSEQIETVAKITNSLDLIGATFESEVVTPYQMQNEEIATDKFDDAYNTIFSVSHDSTKTSSLLNFNEVYADYVQKYANTEQLFLKGMYDFQNYFNSTVNFPTDTKYEVYTIELPEDCNYSFKSNAYVKIPIGYNNSSINYVYKKNVEKTQGGDKTLNWEKIKVVNSKNYQNFYIKIENREKELASYYSPAIQYYDASGVKVTHNSMKTKFIENNRDDFIERTQIEDIADKKVWDDNYSTNIFNRTIFYYDDSLSFTDLWTINHPLEKIKKVNTDDNSIVEVDLVNFNNFKNYKTLVKTHFAYNSSLIQFPLDQFSSSTEGEYAISHPAEYYLNESNITSIDDTFVKDYYYGSQKCYYNTNNKPVDGIQHIEKYNYNKQIKLITGKNTNLWKDNEYYFLPADVSWDKNNNQYVLGDISSLINGEAEKKKQIDENTTVDVGLTIGEDYYSWYFLEGSWFSAFSSLQWGESKKSTLETLYSQIEKVQDQYFFKYGDKYFYLFEVSSYLFNPINTENPLIESLPYIRYANGKEIDWQDTEIYKNYYIDSVKNEDFTIADSFKENENYYEKVSENEFIQVPSFYQLSGEDYYIKEISKYNVSTFLNEKEFEVVLYNNNNKSQENCTFIVTSLTNHQTINKGDVLGTEENGNYLISCRQKDSNNKLNTYSKVHVYGEDNQLLGTYTLNESATFKIPSINWENAIKCQFIDWPYIEINSNTLISLNYNTKDNYSGTPLSTMSNGQFWYQYYSNDNEIIMQHAAEIALTLSDYWQQAYTASKYINYFIPEHWQLYTDGAENKFSNQLYFIEGANETTKGTISLKYDLIPKVIVSNVKDNNFNRYIKYMRTSTDNFDGTLYSLSYVINNNPAVKQMFEQELDFSSTEINNWSCQIINDNTDLTRKTYFAVESDTGMTWQKALMTYVPGHAEFNNFGGLYQMMISFFKQGYYIDNPMTEYTKAREKQQIVWSKIYKSFPNVILEKKYTNTSATTSEELLKMAKLAMRDYSQLEREYNISLIDASHLRGYEGQELSIGLPIQLSAEEYYDGYDDIKTSLNQYLFITDLSYNLRSDSNVSITVNSIKYEDKLIRQLAKLIR